jgi:capsular polysaccharide biosynthesis protein
MEPRDHVDVEALLRALVRRLPTILLTTLACAALAVALGATRTPRYEATAILITGQGKGLGDVRSMQAIAAMTESLAQMSTDRVVIEEAIRRSNLRGVDVDDLAARTSVEAPTDTQRILLTVAGRDPVTTARSANAIADAFSDLVEERATPESNLSAAVWQRAHAPKVAAGPRTSTLGALGAGFGVLLGVLLAALRERLDRRWRSDLDVESWLGLPVLGLVPTAPPIRLRRRLPA